MQVYPRQLCLKRVFSIMKTDEQTEHLVHNQGSESVASSPTTVLRLTVHSELRIKIFKMFRALWPRNFTVRFYPEEIVRNTGRRKSRVHKDVSKPYLWQWKFSRFTREASNSLWCNHSGEIMHEFLQPETEENLCSYGLNPESIKRTTGKFGQTQKEKQLFCMAKQHSWVLEEERD